MGAAGPAREVAVLLAEHRLVTVAGPGGVGKTRLAGQVARQVAGRFADGLCGVSRGAPGFARESLSEVAAAPPVMASPVLGLPAPDGAGAGGRVTRHE